VALISSGIIRAKAFELPCGIAADGDYFGCPRSALITWTCEEQLNGKLFQVYVGRRLAGATIDTEQRKMIVPLSSSVETATRIEVFAVEPEDAFTDLSEELDLHPGESGRVRVVMLRSQSLPLDSALQIYSDGGTGTIDYEQPLNESPIRIWNAQAEKAGFGMSCFGRSDFGYDGAAAVGFGKGIFGNATFGFDADTIEWISPLLSDGVYKFAVVVEDVWGNQSVVVESDEMTVTRAARPARRLSVADYDSRTETLVLNIEQ